MKSILFFILWLVEALLFVRVVLSWIQKERVNRFTIFICDMFEPVLKPLRKVLPTNKVGIDISPIIIFLVLELIKQTLFL